jgi:serine/threonine protein kinase
MATEQERGEAAAASDLYSMAMILFQMTTGRMPFEDPGDWDVKRRLRLRSAGHLAPQLPVEFDGVVARAFHPEPSGRYGACAELITALERLT